MELLSALEFLAHLYSNLRYKMDQDFLNIQYDWYSARWICDRAVRWADVILFNKKNYIIQYVLLYNSII